MLYPMKGQVQAEYSCQRKGYQMFQGSIVSIKTVHGHEPAVG